MTDAAEKDRGTLRPSGTFVKSRRDQARVRFLIFCPIAGSMTWATAMLPTAPKVAAATVGAMQGGGVDPDSHRDHGLRRAVAIAGAGGGVL